MSLLPRWARKPSHKKEVVATSRGWEVKETGELLVSSRGLDARIKELQEEAKVAVEQISAKKEKPIEPTKEEKIEDPASEVKTEETEIKETKEKEEKPKRRKPGRPKKNKD